MGRGSGAHETENQTEAEGLPPRTKDQGLSFSRCPGHPLSRAVLRSGGRSPPRSRRRPAGRPLADRIEGSREVPAALLQSGSFAHLLVTVIRFIALAQPKLPEELLHARLDRIEMPAEKVIGALDPAESLRLRQ